MYMTMIHATTRKSRLPNLLHEQLNVLLLSSLDSPPRLIPVLMILMLISMTMMMMTPMMTSMSIILLIMVHLNTPSPCKNRLYPNEQLLGVNLSKLVNLIKLLGVQPDVANHPTQLVILD
ncbi:hypothetical protein Hdeb2414_s0014g00432771 [Helianthus debilis subsp. tardiflorus]